VQIVIFGASGFVGRNLARHLELCDVIGIDKDPIAQDSLSNNTVFIQKNVFSLNSIPVTSDSFYVVNLMAELGSSDIDKNIENNLQSVEHLYRIVENTKAKCLGIIHFSSISAEREASHYGKSKKDAERVVESRDVPYIILQSEMIIGEGARSIEKLKRGLNIFPFVAFLPSGGRVVRYPIDISDVCETVRLIVKYHLCHNKTYHLISNETTMLELSKRYTDKVILPIPSTLLLFLARVLELFFSRPMFTYDNAVGVCSNTSLSLEAINTKVILEKFSGKT